MSELVLSRREGAVQILTYNNPASRNSIVAGCYEAIGGALAAAQADPDVGAIVLTGAGGYFCSGGDLHRLSSRRTQPAAERRAGVDGLNDLVRSIRDCTKPVVAAIEGGAAGAGVSIALACDLLVAARDASFFVAYVKVGLTPDGGATAFLSELMPRQLLTELCLTGDRLPAERLAQFGAANRLVDKGAAEAEAVALAQRIADGPTRATARIKALCRLAHRSSVDEQLEAEAVRMTESMGDDEAAEGIGAFFAKRRPDYVALRKAAKT